MNWEKLGTPSAYQQEIDRDNATVERIRAQQAEEFYRKQQAKEERKARVKPDAFAHLFGDKG